MNAERAAQIVCKNIKKFPILKPTFSMRETFENF